MMSDWEVHVRKVSRLYPSSAGLDSSRCFPVRMGSAHVELREQQKAERQGACPHCGKPVGGPHED
jgi:hypothetical protein